MKNQFEENKNKNGKKMKETTIDGSIWAEVISIR